MYELSLVDTHQVSGGIDNLSTNATLSTLSGTVIGGGLGTVAALNMSVPTASLLPVWIAACTGAGGAIGTLVGMAFAMGTFSAACQTCLSSK
ncbi:MAG: hypothetical protein AB7V32_10245 [Candidatus Berkiella sp.]